MDTLDHALAAELVVAIHTGDVDTVKRLVAETPMLVSGPLGGRFKTRWALHIAADWPGFWPNAPETVRVLLAAGADPDGRNPGDETALHWAASSDDADVAVVLIDAGADIEVPDGSIGSPLDNAIGYSCWHVASLLVARGAQVDKLWHAAPLGMSDRLQQLLDATQASAEALSQAFWHACAAGQRRTAELLLAAGAGLNWVPDYADGTPLDAAKNRGTQRDNVIDWLEARGARSATVSGDS